MIRILIQADGDTLVDGKFKSVEAVLQLQTTIAAIRQRAAPVFDASWGEQQQPLIAPSAEELSSFINRQ